MNTHRLLGTSDDVKSASTITHLEALKSAASPEARALAGELLRGPRYAMPARTFADYAWNCAETQRWKARCEAALAGVDASLVDATKREAQVIVDAWKIASTAESRRTHDR